MMSFIRTASTSWPILLVSLALAACGPGPDSGTNRYDYTIPDFKFKIADFRFDMSSLTYGSKTTQLSGTRELTLNVDRAQACKNFRKSLSPEVTQALIQVPENRSDPKSPKIEVFYYARLVNHKGKALTGTPVVFFNGGPAMDSHGSFYAMDSLSGAEEVPMVYIDQRGTGCSSAFPDEMKTATLERLSHYGSREIVRDAEAVRIELFKDRRWKVFGQSYGGLIVRRYLEIAPQSIEAAISHGYAISGKAQGLLRERFHKQNELSIAYFKAYPGDEKLLQDIRSQIADDYCYSYKEGAICGPGMVDSLWVLLTGQSTWDRLHSLLRDLVDSKGKVKEQSLANAVTSFGFGTYLWNNLAAMALSAVDVPGGESAVEENAKILPTDADTTSINELHFFGSLHTEKAAELFKSEMAQKLPDPIQVDTLVSQLDRNPGLPFLVYASEKDGAVPVSSYDSERKKFGKRINFQILKSSGHDGYFTEPQLWKDLREVRRGATSH